MLGPAIADERLGGGAGPWNGDPDRGRALAVMWASWATILLLPSVWAVRRPTTFVAPSLA